MIFGDRPIALTPTEFDVLAALSLNEVLASALAIAACSLGSMRRLLMIV